MKFEAYASNCIPLTHVILGLELKPLCLGHYLLMERFGCRYASDEPTIVDLSDLIVGLLICSMSYEENIEFFNQEMPSFWKCFPNVYKYYLCKRFGPAGYEIRKWGHKVISLCKKDPTFNITTKLNAFNNYIQQGTKMPLYVESDNISNKPSGAHWSTNIYNVLISKLGYSRSESLNLPLSQAFTEYCKYAENEGAIEFLLPEEEEMIPEGER